jgi:hypothetical protein
VALQTEKCEDRREEEERHSQILYLPCNAQFEAGMICLCERETERRGERRERESEGIIASINYYKSAAHLGVLNYRLCVTLFLIHDTFWWMCRPSHHVSHFRIWGVCHSTYILPETHTNNPHTCVGGFIIGYYGGTTVVMPSCM